MAYKEPDFSSYDDEELDDVAGHLDREAFSERWASLQAELAHRAKASGSADMAPQGVISAPGTLLYKWIFPAFSLVFLVFWTVTPYTFTHRGSEGPAPPFKVAENPFFLVCGVGLLLAGIYLFIRYQWPLKRVEWVPYGLQVSDFRNEIYVPFAAIASVEQFTKFNYRCVIVQLREDTPFGRRFTFLPRFVQTGPFVREDRIVTDLRKMVKPAYRGDGDLA